MNGCRGSMVKPRRRLDPPSRAGFQPRRRWYNERVCTMDESRETIWGIDPKDRQWFQLLTLIGGIAGSVILTQLELAHGPGGAGPNQVARNILLGIGASFVASGFIAWGLLQLKELTMSIADWIRESTASKRERREQELREARQEALQEGLREGYSQGYADAREGKPMQPPGDDTGKPS